MSTLLLVLPWLSPLLMLPLATTRVARWLPLLAVLPALVTATVAREGTTTELGWLLLGMHLALDGTARLFLLYSSLAWLAATFYLLLRSSAATGKTSFVLCFLLAMAGNLLLILAADMLTFYAGFALMGLSAYGMIVAPGTESSVSAGRRYLAWTIAGELALFSGIVQLASSGMGLLPADPGAGEAPAAAVLLILLGFGVKMALPGLHFWLPSAYRAAPAAAAAVMSGPMLSAGLLGWLRFLPPGTPGLAEWSLPVIILGITGALLGFSGGILQSSARGALAWSSIAKAGSMTAILGAALAAPDAAPLVLAALVLFSLHHLVVKAALFLGMGELEQFGRRGWLLAGLTLLSLSLAGAPWSGGASAKAQLTGALGEAGFDAGLLFTVAAIGTTAVMARFLWLAGRHAGQTAGVAPGWLALALPAVWLPFGLSQAGFSWSSVLALVAGILLFAVTRPLQGALPAWYRPADGWATVARLARWRPALIGRAGAALRAFGMRLAAGRQQQGAAIMQGATAGLLWLVLFALLLSTLLFSA